MLESVWAYDPLLCYQIECLYAKLNLKNRIQGHPRKNRHSYIVLNLPIWIRLVHEPAS